ncbi:hypothetical protein D9619_009615 [Psilocybe cf. subviscida]|uniref:DUF1308 domain-containing protein n=1 Tax=Psilocybe cf. subviscida TaxID=2480587 RepID=A0A8H5F6B4_9AGAR|nr:hypothetical protein D9619_009615 [Psilocybe cf. subviscida]
MQGPHPELQKIRRHLSQIHDGIAHFKPLTARPPICDASFEDAARSSEVTEENQWLHQESVPGLRKLKESIRIDLGVLDKFLGDPQCANLPPLSTNAPYLVAVWNEVLTAPPPTVSVFKTFPLQPASKSATDKEKFKKKNDPGHPPGVKVDVVADNGRCWIRVNTIKNSRLLSEFREIDSYLTDSSDEFDADEQDTAWGPSLAQKQFDNSILRMGHSLVAAARANPVGGTSEIPRITLRLTRLDPAQPNDDGSAPDPRIAQTLELLEEMGVAVELGERTLDELPDAGGAGTSLPLPTNFVPTKNVNLDLSVLIALISDLTHSALPSTIEEANARFVPPPEYREWKAKRLAATGKAKPSGTSGAAEDGAHDLTNSIKMWASTALETDINDLPSDLIKHSRALTNQLLQEMGRGLLREVHDRLACEGDLAAVTFWTTMEARDRCLRIVAKIGGVQEKRRARALFCLGSGDQGIPLEDANRVYWQGSRFPQEFVPLLPINILPSSSPVPTALQDVLASVPPSLAPKTTFGLSLSRVCADILAQETMSHPRALPEELLNGDTDGTGGSRFEIQRATVTKANPRLTAHTVQSMQWGAALGWTTLTANRTSVKAMLRELKSARIAGRLSGGGKEDSSADQDIVIDDSSNLAAFWIVDPRSLAEGMVGNVISTPASTVNVT